MEPYYSRKNVTIYRGDVLQVLRQIPDESVNCVVTSPPYWGLRQYLFDGAVIIRRDLCPEKHAEILAELERINVKPKY